MASEAGPINHGTVRANWRDAVARCEPARCRARSRLPSNSRREHEMEPMLLTTNETVFVTLAATAGQHQPEGMQSLHPGCRVIGSGWGRTGTLATPRLVSSPLTTRI